MSSIRLHPVHGVNPSVEKCYFCNEDKAVVLFGSAYKGEAPRSVVLNTIPCDKCKSYMEQGIILISIRDNEPAPEYGRIPDPYRTGGFVVVREEAVKSFMANAPDILQETLKHRVAFIEDSTWDKIGLPRESAK